MKKKRRITIPLIVEFVIIFLIIQTFNVISSIDLFKKGIAYQAITNEAESADTIAQNLCVDLFADIDDVSWLFRYWIEHPEAMKIPTAYESVDTDLKRLDEKYGWSGYRLKKSDVESMSEEEKAECASILYRNIYSAAIRYSLDIKDTLDYPMLAAVIDSKKYMLLNFDDDYPYKAGDEVIMTRSDALPEASEEEKKSIYYIGDKYYLLEKTDKEKKNYGVIVCPIERDDELCGYVIVGITSSILEKTNTRLAQMSLNTLIYITIGAAVLLLVFALLIIIIPINRIHRGVREYASRKDSDGLKLRMKKIHSLNEIGRLSDGISDMADEIQDYIEETTRIAEEQSRAEAELSFAKRIQTSAVPRVFPPFPERKEFGLYAMMDTAKLVGGDFYDFFFNSDDKLVLVIADVSDKGVPAAMFMMMAKTLIRSYALQGLPVDEVAERTNIALCENNDGEMFVTAWIGYIDLKTGQAEYVHAGHTIPVVSGEHGVETIDREKDLMLGSFDDADYHVQTWKLSPGDTLYLYTDGVNEAADPQGELYGEKRLMEVIGNYAAGRDASDLNSYSKQICQAVYEDVKAFAGEAEQADDITMISFSFRAAEIN